MEYIKNKRILAIVGIVCLILGTMLPYMTFTILGYSQSISLWGYWEGKIVLVLTLANALIIFKDLIEKYVPQLFNNGLGRMLEKVNNPKYSLVPTLLAVAFIVYLAIRLDIDSEFAKYGLGFYLLWLGIIALVGHAIFYKVKKEEVVSNTTNYNQVQQTMNNVQTNTKYCPYCGNAVDMNASNCSRCGNNL